MSDKDALLRECQEAIETALFNAQCVIVNMEEQEKKYNGIGFSTDDERVFIKCFTPLLNKIEQELGKVE